MYLLFYIYLVYRSTWIYIIRIDGKVVMNTILLRFDVMVTKKPIISDLKQRVECHDLQLKLNLNLN